MTDKAQLRQRLKGAADDPLVENILALYGVQAVNYLLPLITVPYLARVLHPAAWGLVSFAQVFGNVVILIVQYGFNFSASREVARHRDADDKLEELLAAVLGAKGLLALFAAGGAIVAYRWVPAFRDQPSLLWAVVFWSLAQSFNMAWYYQGLERLRLVAIVDVSAKTLVTAGIFLLVRSPDDVSKLFVLQGLGSLLSVMVLMAVAYHEVPFSMPTVPLTSGALRSGLGMFVSQGAVTLYSNGNIFILGLFTTQQVVGYYAGAEKIIRAFLGLLDPLTRALYGRLSQQVYHARGGAARLVRIALAVMGVGGTLTGLLVFGFASFLVKLALGPAFDPAVPVLRVLAILPVLIGVSIVLGIQWMLPLGLERQFNSIVLGAGLLHLMLAMMLAPRFSHVGVAWALVLTELFVTGAFYIYLRWRGLDPVTYAKDEGETHPGEG